MKEKNKQQGLGKIASIIMLSFAIIAITLFGNVNIVKAEDLGENRTIEVSTRITFPYAYYYSNSTETANMVIRQDSVIVGAGKFVKIAYKYKYLLNERLNISCACFIVSDLPFTITYDHEIASDTITTSTQSGDAIPYGGYYYRSVGVRTQSVGIDSVMLSGFGNVTTIETDVVTQLKADIDSGLIDVSEDNYMDPDFENATYSADIPTPKVSLSSNLDFGFNNSCDDYYFELKGRWFSIDDIELYKSNLMWNYSYDSILKGSLSNWVIASDKIKCDSDSFNLSTLGNDAFQEFLTQYPIDSRTYTGGTNSVGNYFSGYDDALSQMKMLLSVPASLYNGVEIYVRYYTINDGVVQYGKWSHLYTDLASSSGSSGSTWDDDGNIFDVSQSENGLSDSQLEDVESLEDSRLDADVKEESTSDTFHTVVFDEFTFNELVNHLMTLYEQSLVILNLFTVVFGFLPTWVRSIIYCSLCIVCFIGIYKALKG